MNPQLDALVRALAWADVALGLIVAATGPFLVSREGAASVVSSRRHMALALGAVMLLGGIMVLALNPRPAAKAASPPSDSIVTYKVGSATMGKYGWYHADSSDGDFSVEFPFPYSDLTMRAKRPDGLGESTVYLLRASRTDGIKLTAAKLPSSSVVKSAADLLEAARAKGLVVEDVTRIFDYAGMRATEWLEQGSEAATYFRVLEYPQGALVLTVEYPLSKSADAQAYKSRFFDTLIIKAPRKASDPAFESLPTQAPRDLVHP